MKLKWSYIVSFGMLLAIVTTVIMVWQSKQAKFNDAVANEKVIQVQSFHVSSDSTNLKTSVEGTLFVSGGEERAEHVQVVARIEVDAKDWGGVAFYIPNNWYISNITSSYPENRTGSNPTDYVSTWTTSGEESPWRAMVEVGRNRSYEPTGGGTGIIVIDLIPDKKATTQSTLGIEVGSNEEDGKKIMGTDSIEVPISINTTATQ